MTSTLLFAFDTPLPPHDFTIDELHAFAEGTLSPLRAAHIQAHLDAGCAACRAWIAASDPLGRLLNTPVWTWPPPDAEGDADAAVPIGWRERTGRWARRRVRPQRLTVLAIALPLKLMLAALVVRRGAPTELRVGAGLSIAAMSAAVLRYVLWRPNWLTTTTPNSGRAGGQENSARPDGHAMNAAPMDMARNDPDHHDD